jgi:Domain of unknown function (DUF5666)
MNRRTLIAALLIAYTSVLLHAHGGMIHVMGTVTGITDTSVTVETTDKKSVEVQILDTTTFLNGSKPADRKDVKVGDRVVIHAVKVKDSLQAHEVRFSLPAPATSH